MKLKELNPLVLRGKVIRSVMFDMDRQLKIRTMDGWLFSVGLNDYAKYRGARAVVSYETSSRLGSLDGQRLRIPESFNFIAGKRLDSEDATKLSIPIERFDNHSKEWIENSFDLTLDVDGLVKGHLFGISAEVTDSKMIDRLESTAKITAAEFENFHAIKSEVDGSGGATTFLSAASKSFWGFQTYDSETLSNTLSRAVSLYNIEGEYSNPDDRAPLYNTKKLDSLNLGSGGVHVEILNTVGDLKKSEIDMRAIQSYSDGAEKIILKLSDDELYDYSSLALRVENGGVSGVDWHRGVDGRAPSDSMKAVAIDIVSNLPRDLELYGEVNEHGDKNRNIIGMQLGT